jgi:hypothetical protein
MKMAKIAKKTSNKLYVAALQDEDGKIQRIFTGNNYEQVWLMASTESKASRGFYTLFDAHGRFIDGNFKQVAIK